MFLVRGFHHSAVLRSATADGLIPDAAEAGYRALQILTRPVAAEDLFPDSTHHLTG